jgi:hypothetical protein
MTRPRIISSRTPQTELERFAARFHQDWGLEFSSAYELADEYIARLDAGSRAALKLEVQAFLSGANKSDRVVRTWARSGLTGFKKGLERLQQRL